MREGIRLTPNAAKKFTIVEMLVVIAILLILMSLLLPSFRQALETARRTACASNLHQIGNAFSHYFEDNMDRAPYGDTFERVYFDSACNFLPKHRKERYYFMDYEIWSTSSCDTLKMSGPRGPGYLLIFDYLDGPGNFVCPSNSVNGAHYAEDMPSYKAVVKVWNTPSFQQKFKQWVEDKCYANRGQAPSGQKLYGDDMITSYGFRFTGGRPVVDQHPQGALMTDFNVEGEKIWLEGEPGNSKWYNEYTFDEVHLEGFNVLYVDGAVNFHFGPQHLNTLGWTKEKLINVAFWQEIDRSECPSGWYDDPP